MKKTRPQIGEMGVSIQMVDPQQLDGLQWKMMENAKKWMITGGTIHFPMTKRKAPIGGCRLPPSPAFSGIDPPFNHWRGDLAIWRTRHGTRTNSPCLITKALKAKWGDNQKIFIFVFIPLSCKQFQYKHRIIVHLTIYDREFHMTIVSINMEFQ